MKALNALGPENISRCPGFEFRNTSVHPDSVHGKLRSFKPDICCYSVEHLDKVAIQRKKNEPSPSVHSARSSMIHAALFFELKSSPELDCFADPPDHVDRRSWKFVLNLSHLKDQELHKRVKTAFGQHVGYATDILARQHRHCCYSVSMSGTHARLIRWDRAGAIVSTSFDLLEQPSILCEFLWCFGRGGVAKRGYDLTIRAANATQQDIFKAAVTKHISYQLEDRDSATQQTALNEHYQPGSVVKLKMDCDGHPPDGRLRLLICRPVSYPLSPTGRGTRGYWAVDSDPPHDVYFLKDTWRYNRLGSFPSKKEGDIIRSLQAGHVPNVPQVKCDGDVLIRDEHLHYEDDRNVRTLRNDLRTWANLHACTQTDVIPADPQMTQTQNYLNADWVCGASHNGGRFLGRIAAHTHYRLVLKVAGYSLLSFTGTSELLHATYDAFKGESKRQRFSMKLR